MLLGVHKGFQRSEFTVYSVSSFMWPLRLKKKQFKQKVEVNNISML